METYEIDTIKIEKEKAMQRYRMFKKIANIVKTVEILVAIMLIFITISWTTSYVPTALEFCGAFLKRVSSLMFSPHFVFLVGNVIVITLFANSQHETVHVDVNRNGDGDSDGSHEDKFEESSPRIVHVDVNRNDDGDFDGNVVADVTPLEAEVVEKAVEEERPKVYRRTQSDVRMDVVVDEKKELRRSKTEPRRRKEVAMAEARRMRMHEEDELSNEEFRRKVEAFIERQQKFLMEESKAVVLSSYEPS